MSEAAGPPRFAGVLETCLYHPPEVAERCERFYREVLGLEFVSRWPGGIALRIGAGVLLLFDLAELERREGPIAAHGSSGPGHACFVVAQPAEYESWHNRLAAAGVEITHEHSWGTDRRSFYFSDPAGNLLEIADGDLWPGSA